MAALDASIINLDTKKIKYDEALPACFFELSSILKDMGWFVKISCKNHFVKDKELIISAEKDEWGNCRAINYRYGYMSKSNSEKDVIYALNRLVVLCRAVELIFKDSIPSVSIDKNGFIKEDKSLIEVNEEGLAAVYTYLRETFINEGKNANEGVNLKRGFINFNSEGTSVLFGKREIDEILAYIDGARCNGK